MQNSVEFCRADLLNFWKVSALCIGQARVISSMQMQNTTSRVIESLLEAVQVCKVMVQVEVVACLYQL